MLAYTYAPFVTAFQVEIIGYNGFVLIWILNVVFTMKIPKINKDAALIIAVLVARGVIDYFLMLNFHNAFAEHATTAGAVFLAAMVLLGFKHEPIKEIVALGVFGTHFIAITTNSPILYALGNAYTATLFQGRCLCGVLHSACFLNIHIGLLCMM
jgi:hypothetical protein